MLLSLDLGNTSLKGVLWRDARAHLCFRLAHDERPESRLSEALRACTRAIGVASHGVLERSPAVVDEVTRGIEGDCAWVGHDVDAPGLVEYDDVTELGLDRRLAVWGAFRDFGAGLVVDGGTAVTFTHIDSAGTIRGLAIGSGLRSTRRGLGEAAPALDPLIGDAPLDGLPRGSRQNLAIGIEIAWDAGMRGVLRDVSKRLRAVEVARGRVYLTGSDAVRLRAALRVGRIEPGLVHRGLRALR